MQIGDGVKSFVARVWRPNPTTLLAIAAPAGPRQSGDSLRGKPAGERGAASEIRPHGAGEHEFGVGRFPELKIAQAPSPPVRINRSTGRSHGPFQGIAESSRQQAGGGEVASRADSPRHAKPGRGCPAR